MAIHSSILAWRTIDRGGAWQATSMRSKESGMTEVTSTHARRNFMEELLLRMSRECSLEMESAPGEDEAEPLKWQRRI